MKINEYYALKKGDIVEWADTGSKCIVMHFDVSDYPSNNPVPLQEPNNTESLCVIFFEDNFRLIGHRREFGYISRKKSE